MYYYGKKRYNLTDQAPEIDPANPKKSPNDQGASKIVGTSG
jgi:hypothetical protein